MERSEVYHQYTLQTIDLQNIVGPLFPTRFLGDPRLLMSSVQTFGILTPPILYFYNDQYWIIDGASRLSIAQQTHSPKVLCFVYSAENMSMSEAFLLCLERNRWSRQFNLVEKSLLLQEAHRVFSGHKIPKIFWDLVEISQNVKTVQNHKDLIKLPETILKYCVNNNIALHTILLFQKFPREELEKIAAKLFVLPLNQNKLNEILSMLVDLSLKEQISAVKILEEIIQTLGQHAPTNRIEQLRNFLQQRRYPHYHQTLSQFETKIKNLPITSQVKVEPAPFFEDDYIDIHARLNNRSDFSEFVNALRDKKWESFFKN